MTQPSLLGGITAAEVPDAVWNRIAAFIAQSASDMNEPGAVKSKEESQMPGARFVVGGCTVRIDQIRVTVTKNPKGM